jgi:Asp-tRNA(Asn)/Glu-tRNA(Gln) amidotransferase A subunit family amidase
MVVLMHTHAMAPLSRVRLVLASVGPCLVLALGATGCRQQPAPSTAREQTAQTAEAFEVVETTIRDIHSAIRSNRLTCRDLVQAYVDRAAAYNGNCTRLVTENGGATPAVPGVVRAGKPVQFPTDTVPASAILPNLDEYAGLPIEYGRMEPTQSDPSVFQQYGMRVGIPDAGQLNALETLNLRGERSVTCKADCDRHPSQGALPAQCPSTCEAFRQQPDALERAAQLDAEFGNAPDLEKLPLYCIPFSFKNWYDSKDMRSTGGNDVAFAMDAPPVDSTVVATLREKGAIVYAVANAQQIDLTTRGPARAVSVLPNGNYALSAWSGQACNPYDTERVPRGTSSGSAVAVSANLVTCSICEQGAASCMSPASKNNIVNLLTTKGILTDGGLNSQRIGDRAGIHCRSVEDAVTVLDTLKGYRSRDMFTAIPRSMIPEQPYRSALVTEAAVESKPLAGVRIGVVREFMVKHGPNDAAISDLIDKEIKTVLRDRLGAELVESIDPLYPDDPDVENMKYSFSHALAEILAHNVPEYLWQRTNEGDLEFAVPGWDVTTVDYAVALALGKAPLSAQLNLRRISSGLDNTKSPFTVAKYLAERGDTRIVDWGSWVANAKWRDDGERAGSQNAVNMQDLRAPEGTMSYLKMRTVLQHVVLKVMYENDIDVFVNPETTLPPLKIGGPAEPTVNNRGSNSCCSTFTALLGGPEIEVPAGYNQVVYEPKFALSSDRTRYISVAGEEPSQLRVPMPVSMMFWAGPGSEPALIRAASAYEVATRHRVPPKAFGPLATRPETD